MEGGAEEELAGVEVVVAVQVPALEPDSPEVAGLGEVLGGVGPIGGDAGHEGGT